MYLKPSSAGATRAQSPCPAWGRPSSPPNAANLVVACQLLAPELLCMVLTLARPNSCLPAICSQVRTICTENREIQIAWRNSVLLGDPLSRPPVPNDRLDFSVAIHRSNLQTMLGSLLPTAPDRPDCPATGIAPSHPASPDLIFTLDYLRHLYKHTLLRQSTSGDGCIGPADNPKCMPLGMLSLADAKLAPLPRQYNWWRPVTDALLLPAYLLRAGQLDLLDRCLGFLLDHPFWPNLAEHKIYYFGWGALCLDGRLGTQELFFPTSFRRVQCEEVPYPLALVTFALLEWSLPALKIILAHFPNVSTESIIRLVSSTAEWILWAMFKHLASPSCFLPNNMDRIIDLYVWLYSSGMHALRYPLISLLVPSAPSVECLIRALVMVDLPYLAVARDLGAEFGHRARSRIMSNVMKCFAKFGEQEILPIVVAHGVIRPNDWAGLVASRFEKWWPLVCEHVPLESDRKSIALEALRHALQPSDQPETAAPGILELIGLVCDHFGVDLLDTMLNNDLAVCYCHYNLLFIALHTNATTGAGAAPRIDPAAALVLTLDYLETTASQFLPFDNHTHELCSMATMFFYFIRISGNALLAARELDPICNMSPSQLGMLTAAVLVTIALADKVMSRFMPLDCQYAVIESLVAHTCTVLRQPDPSSPARFFERVTPSLRATVAGMIRHLVSIETAVVPDINQHVLGYCTNPAHVKWIIMQLVQLDPRFVAAAVGPLWDGDAIACVHELVLAEYQACARASWGLVDLVMRGEQDKVGVYWETVGSSTAGTKEDVERMTQWMTEAEDYSDHEGDWRSSEIGLEEEVVQVVARLFD